MSIQTADKIEYFKQRVNHYFFEVFKMVEFFLEISEGTGLQDNRARTYWHDIETGSGMIQIEYQKEWIGDNSTTIEEIDKVAFHEVCEAMLWELDELIYSRFIQKKDIPNAKHRVIRRLENVFFPFIKAIITVFLVFSIVSTAHAKGWLINGIPADRIIHSSAKERLAMVGGLLTSFAVHTAGHILVLEATGTDWHMDGIHEVSDEYLNNTEAAWIGRAGFLSQLIFGTVLKHTKYRHTFFATGYHFGSFAEISTHPFMHENRKLSGATGLIGSTGDLGCISRSNEAGLEYIAYTLWSFELLAN